MRALLALALFGACIVTAQGRFWYSGTHVLLNSSSSSSRTAWGNGASSSRTCQWLLLYPTHACCLCALPLAQLETASVQPVCQCVAGHTEPEADSLLLLYCAPVPLSSLRCCAFTCVLCCRHNQHQQLAAQSCSNGLSAVAGATVMEAPRSVHR